MYPKRSSNPKLIGCIGIVFLLLSILIIVVQWNNLKRMPSQPIRLQLSTLSEQIKHTSTEWINIEGGHWDCKSIKINNASKGFETKALYTGDGKDAIYATLNGKMSCEELNVQPATGELVLINEKMLASLKEENQSIAQLPPETIVYGLCTYCGPNNSRAGIFVGCFLIPVSLVIVVYAIQEHQKRTIQIFGSGK